MSFVSTLLYRRNRGRLFTSLKMKEFPDAPVFTVLANTKDGMEEILLEEVQECTDGRCVDINGVLYFYRIDEKLNNLAELQVRLAAIHLTGYSLCGIILLIGLMNMVNSALTSMVLRRREFALPETVGMTRAQQSRMLLYENSVDGVFGLASFVVSSVLLNVLLTQTFGVDIAPISSFPVTFIHFRAAMPHSETFHKIYLNGRTINAHPGTSDPGRCGW